MTFWQLGAALLIAASLIWLTACSPKTPLRYMHPEQAVDPEWGYPGSQARIEVSGRVAASALVTMDEELGLLLAMVTITNVEEDEIRLIVGACPVQIQAFANAELEGTPVWDSFRTPTLVCPGAERPRRLFSLEDYEIPITLHQRAILRDSLPSGRYYFAAFIRPNGILMDLPAGSALLVRE